MDAMWGESDCRTPMICFLSMGSDPTDNIERLAKAKGISTCSCDCGDMLTEMLRSLELHLLVIFGTNLELYIMRHYGIIAQTINCYNNYNNYAITIIII